MVRQRISIQRLEIYIDPGVPVSGPGSGDRAFAGYPEIIYPVD
jgi:hypothetical protein